jgi:hypothetical protein
LDRRLGGPQKVRVIRIIHRGGEDRERRGREKRMRRNGRMGSKLIGRGERRDEKSRSMRKKTKGSDGIK